jgi:uncharacterized protein (DUF58 family)
MHNYNIVYIMMFFLVSVAGTSTLFGMRNLYPLELHFLSHDRFFAHENASFTLTASNNANYEIYDLHFHYKEKITSLPSLGAQSTTHLSFSTRFETRGKHTLEKIHIESLFPLVHERKFRDIDLENALLVYPHPKGESLLHHLAMQKKNSGDFNDFEGIKKFVQGESISSIHWSSLAKNDTLMRKVFLFEEKQEKLHFRLEDLSGDIETKLSQLTLWVLECEQLGFSFLIDLHAKTLDSKKEETDAILSALALY